MKIIISPAKKMNRYTDEPGYARLPFFLREAEQLKECLRGFSYEALKRLLCTNDRIATLNFERYRDMDLLRDPAPALLSYDGIQYQYMAPQVFERSYFDYVENHLRILSGFYGLLRPLDGIVPYRLEMQAKLKMDFCDNLYGFWGGKLYSRLTRNDHTILNLASAEYSRAISKYLTPEVTYITCTFGEWENGKIREKGVYVKMARGEMVRFMAENKIEKPGDVKYFNRLGYSYRSGLSTPTNYIFLKG